MTYRRKRKLVNPRLQGRLAVVFVSISCVSALFQVVLLNSSLVSLGQTLPNDGDLMLGAARGLLVRNLLITVLFLVPWILWIGVLATFRLAGPVYRLETYLRDVVDGTAEGPCRIRKDDELQELCGLINDALEVTAERAAEGRAEGLDRAA